MTREMALRALSSDSSHKRLIAARFLIRHVDSSDIPLLRRALQTETVSYVRNCLDIGIKQATDVWPETPGDSDDEL